MHKHVWQSYCNQVKVQNVLSQSFHYLCLQNYSFTFKVFYMQIVIQEKPNFTRHAYIWSELAVERLYCLMDSNSIEKNIE